MSFCRLRRIQNTHTNTDISSSSTYPFPPPGLSKPPSINSHSSIWSNFQMDSFIANYSHTSTNHNHHSTTLTLNPPAPNLPPSSPSPPQLNPLIAQRQRQQAFMTSWNRIRGKNRYAPAMPSFFNPARSEAPQCAWNFLRDPACGGAVNERVTARRGRDSIFEKALVKLPLTRCRSICDRVRRDQQNYLGWGIHAWIGPSKHCRSCASDALLQGLLAYRAFELERAEEEARRRQEHSMLMTSSSPLSESVCEDMVDPDAVLLSFPYPHRQDEQQPHIPTDPWVNYNDLDPSLSTTMHSESKPNDIDAWSEELEKRLLASPVIRDLDAFDLENLEDDDDGFYDSDEGDDDDDDEDDGYSSSETSSSSSSDICENDDIPLPVDIDTSKPESKGEADKKRLEQVCGTVLMSLWQEGGQDGIECVGSVQAPEREAEEEWVKDLRIVDVQVQA